MLAVVTCGNKIAAIFCRIPWYHTCICYCNNLRTLVHNENDAYKILFHLGSFLQSFCVI